MSLILNCDMHRPTQVAAELEKLCWIACILICFLVSNTMIELSLLLPVPPDKEFQRIELYRPCDRTVADEEAIMVRVNVRQFRGFLTLVVVHPFFLTVDSYSTLCLF